MTPARSRRRAKSITAGSRHSGAVRPQRCVAFFPIRRCASCPLSLNSQCRRTFLGCCRAAKDSLLSTQDPYPVIHDGERSHSIRISVHVTGSGVSRILARARCRRKFYDVESANGRQKPASVGRGAPATDEPRAAAGGAQRSCKPDLPGPGQATLPQPGAAANR